MEVNDCRGLIHERYSTALLAIEKFCCRYFRLEPDIMGKSDRAALFIALHPAAASRLVMFNRHR